MIDPEKIRISVQNQVMYSDDVCYDIDDYINDLTEEEKDWAYLHLGMHQEIDIIIK
jgi:hypothetical protein